MTTTAFTNGVTLTDAAWFNDVDSAVYPLTAVAGTNTITATGPSSFSSYASNQYFMFIPAATNTGATTINIGSVGAKNIFHHGVACSGGELIANVPTLIKYDGTRFQIIGPGAPRGLHGKCYLSKSSTNLLLSPKDGNTIIINSALQYIPDAGVTLAPTSLASDTTYKIYAYMSGTTMTLEAVTTAHATQAGTGIEIKSADATRTFVGLARTNGSTAWEDDNTLLGVISYFNRRNKAIVNHLTANRTTTSATYVELNSEARANFLTFGDESVIAAFAGALNNSAAAVGQVSIGFNDSTTPSDVVSEFNGATTAASPIAGTIYKAGLTEGFNDARLIGQISGGFTLTLLGGSAGAASSLTVMVRG